MKKIIILFIACLFIIIAGCEKKQSAKSKYHGKRILVVHSYHAQLKGVQDKNSGLIHVLKNEDIEYKIIYMDTKRNTSEEYKKKAALIAKKTIEEYKPNVVITFDDNAFKYLIMPYYKNSDLPVVFSGIDWDASIYGAPYENTAGMISVALALQVIDAMKKYANGERISWLGYDTFTSRKETKAYQDILGINMSTHYVTNYKEWQDAFLQLQSNTDIIIHSGMLTGMEDWNESDAIKFALNNIKVPIVTVDKYIMSCSVLGIVKIQKEYGDWVAKTALEIIDGKAPADLPLTQNKEGKIILNLNLAEKLDIAFDVKILKNAQIYHQDE